MGNIYNKTKIACYGGYTVQAVINNFLPVLFIVFQNRYNLSYEKLGRIVFINFFVQIFADVFSSKLVKWIGLKKSAVLCHFLAFLGLGSLSFLPKIIPNTYFAIILSVIIYAFGSGIVEVTISPIIEYLPTDNKSGNMSVLHSFYCWGQAFTIVLSTVLLKIYGDSFWAFVPLTLAVIPFVNMIFFMFVPVVEYEKKNEEQGQKEEKYYKNKKFIYVIILMITSGACEIAMSQWASIFAQNGLGISKVKGDILGPCAFALFMGVGRILYAVLSEKVDFPKVAIISGIMCFICYLVVGLCEIPIISLIFCALCGITVSTLWPGTISLATKTFPNAGTGMFSIIALCGDMGCSVGPWIVGLVADRYTLNIGLLATSVFPITLIITALLFMKEKD